MKFNVSSPGPLSGRIKVPGDLRLTLALMSLGMYIEEPLLLRSPSKAQEVSSFRGFLEKNGVVINESDDELTIKGKRPAGEITIGFDICDSILHIFSAGAVFSAQSVRIIGGASFRSRITGPLVNVLALLGVADKCVVCDGDDVIISGAEFSPPDVFAVRSQWALEVVIAASLAARSAVTISFPPGILPLPERALNALGFRLAPAENTGNYNAELERRLAKAAGDRPPEVRRLHWEGNPANSFEIPGDTTLAAAVAGCAAVIQRSDVTLEGVVWDTGRRGFFDALRRMKAQVAHDFERSGMVFNSADIRVKWSILEGTHFSPEQADTMSSELLVLAAVASSATGETVISDIEEPPGVGREAFKFVARGLEKYGVHIGDYTEGIVLRGGNEFSGDEVDSGGRPDVACALAVAGMAASGTTTVIGCPEDMFPVGEFLRLIDELSGNAGEI